MKTTCAVINSADKKDNITFVYLVFKHKLLHISTVYMTFHNALKKSKYNN